MIREPVSSLCQHNADLEINTNNIYKQFVREFEQQTGTKKKRYVYIFFCWKQSVQKFYFCTRLCKILNSFSNFISIFERLKPQFNVKKKKVEQKKCFGNLLC